MKRIVAFMSIMIYLLAIFPLTVNADEVAAPAVVFASLTESAVKAETVNCGSITGGKIVLSIHDNNGVLVDLYTKDFAQEVTFDSVNLSQKEGTAKLMLWQSLDTLIPLTVMSQQSFDFTDDDEALDNTETETVNLDGYDNISPYVTNWTIEYIDENNNYAETSRIANDADILYNGVSINNPELGLIFGTDDSSLIYPDSGYSGQIVLSKSEDDLSVFDTVSIEVSAGAIVNEVTAQGNVEFTDITVPYIRNTSIRYSSLNSINCSDCTVTITKDGKACDYSAIKAGDVIAVLWNGQDDIYTINILGSNSYVDGYVVSENARKGEYKIGDIRYRIAKESYAEGAIELGSTGRFYIDAYGKIFDFDSAATSPAVNYAFVLNAAVESDSWGKRAVRVQMLNNNGEIREVYLAETVTLKNFDVKDDDVITAYGENVYDKVTVEVADSAEGADALAAALMGNLIIYSANSSEEISTITMPTTDEDDSFYVNSFSPSSAIYDETDMMLGRLCGVDDSTVVFVINAKSGNSVGYDEEVAMSPTNSSVETASYFKNNQTYSSVLAFDVDYGTEVAGAVVLLNEEISSDEGDEDGTVLSSCAFVLNSTVEYNAWGESLVAVKLLDKSGEIFDAYLAEKVKLENFDVKDSDVLTAYGKAADDSSAPVEVGNDIEAANALSCSLMGNLITYSLSSSGEIRTITMPATEGGGNFYVNSFDAYEVVYNEDDMSLGNLCTVDDSTAVFVINSKNGDTVDYDEETVMSSIDSSVKSSSFFSHNQSYTALAFNVDSSSGVARSVVILNADVGDAETDNETSGDAESGNYAYVLASNVEENVWGGYSVCAQILDKNGEVSEVYLAEKVKLENFDVKDSVVIEEYGRSVSDKVTVEVADSVDGAVALADALRGNLITYSTNNSGKIKAITMPATDDNDNFYVNSFIASSVTYDANDMSLGSLCTVNDSTAVFVINGKYGPAAYDDEEGAFSSTRSFVETADFFSHLETYEVLAFDVDINSDAAGAVVLLNHDYSAGQSENIAVINSISRTLSGSDIVLTVEYYMDGELKEAETDPDWIDADTDDLAVAEYGDVFKFKVSNGVIKKAVPYMVFDRSGEKAYDLDAAVTPVIADFKTSLGAYEDAYFAVATDKRNSSRYTVIKASDFDFNVIFEGEEHILKDTDNPNVYVYDPSLRGDNQLTIGSLGDITVEDNFFDTNYSITYDDETIDTPAYGMADYVFVREFDGDVMDIVIYKNYKTLLDNYEATRN